MSTLNQGKTSNKIVMLRQAALKEADAIPAGVTKSVRVDFDKDNSRAVNPNSFDQDKNGVSQYPGPDSPHVGNGSGGIR